MLKFVVGADECGYGSIMGNLTVCGLKAPQNWFIPGLKDSKQLTERQRLSMGEKLSELLDEGVISCHIAERSSADIDSLGLSPMLHACYEEVFIKLACEDSELIADGILKFDKLTALGYNVKSIIKADTKIPTVMAASIIGKNHRDAGVKLLHLDFPQYNWKSNKGYCSAEHIKAIKEFGLSPLHRKSYHLKALD